MSFNEERRGDPDQPGANGCGPDAVGNERGGDGRHVVCDRCGDDRGDG